MTPGVADQVWSLLVAEAGAMERDRWVFVHYLTSHDELDSWEYRFMGVFGFGGKLHYDTYRGAWISCYPEDATTGSAALIEDLNERLSCIAPGTRP